MANEKEMLKPVVLRDTQEDVTYTLDFDRAAIVFAEDRKFVIEDVLKYPVTLVPDLFFYSFRKNHRNISREKTDRLYKAYDPMPMKVVGRLISLYNQAAMANFETSTDEDEAKKNTRFVVEMDED